MQNNTFSTLFVGQNLIKLLEVDSTNNFLKVLVSNSEPLTEGTVIMADKQFAGRGQQDNVWHAEPGLNLTFSLFLKPSFLPVGKQFLLNMAVSIGIRNALQSFVKEGIRIKWPNDIYFGDQKMGGVLIENILSGSTYKAGIVGIGINVNQDRFDPSKLKSATSLKEILQQDVNLIELLAEICSHIEKQYLQLKAGSYQQLMDDYVSGLYKFNEPAAYRQNGEVIEGRIIEVTESGLLGILTNGELKHYNFKEVEFLNYTP
ncbi:biotin--[acetyl-CoA-carboxylase] ligase [Pedobacter caeni]|uniref:BirA family transcriptional regulator, biotin operon repressor / biotin-[acetyl-CoA-carboxylase] ligase n=1 Tax=Pedobacter caeni TaxID=288992 RepID=A0A1M5MKJ4_9SPHI|nr:biotin--[acetyl-CoA-carboxylase] ligase [Pedobacter caeni]SHG77572.1 BirA family transcriptional regulator, biotin operon repressor / biotin-[acetyl-CoA-carboxylase] ligase [Pedobacter caeni]